MMAALNDQFTTFFVVLLVAASSGLSNAHGDYYTHDPPKNESSEKALVRQLLEDYGDTSVRPVRDHTQPVQVFFRMLLYELIDLDQTKQTLTLRTNMRMQWVDEYLQWEPEEHGGVPNITLKMSQVWRPDFVLDEGLSRDFISLPEEETYVIVQHTGDMDWLFPAVTISACKMNIEFFPFDSQVCNVTIYPWTLDDSKMRFFAKNDEDATQKRYVRNGVWSLEGFQPVNVSYKYICCPFPNDHITYTLILKRESGFFVTNVVVPAIFLTVLMLIGFWLHPESGEKVTFTVTNLLALILFQQLVADNMPPIGEPRSVLVTCFFILIILSGCSVFLSVLTLRIFHHEGDSTPPRWAARLLTPWLARGAKKRFRKFYKYAPYTPSPNITTISNKLALETRPRDNHERGVPIDNGHHGNGVRNDDCTESWEDPVYLWKQMSLAFDSFCGTLLTFCMLGSILYAAVNFVTMPKTSPAN